MRYHELLKLYGLDPRIFDIIEETVGQGRRNGGREWHSGSWEGIAAGRVGQCSVIQDAPPEEMEDETLYHCYTKEEFVSLSDPACKDFFLKSRVPCPSNLSCNEGEDVAPLEASHARPADHESSLARQGGGRERWHNRG